MAFDSIAFYLKVRILRWLTRLLAWLDRRRHPASTRTPSSQLSIPSNLSSSPENFDIFFYHPLHYNHKSTKEAQYPIVIVLHGGGWCVGHARHDERFIETLTARGAVVAAVNYRLAPEHPYPAPLSNCLDAILYIWKNAKTMGIDKHRTFITGFSVGGQMAFASLFMLWKALQDKDPRIDPASLGTVKGITAFYPPMDLTRTRPERAASNPAFFALKKKPVSSSKLIGDIFDRAYFWKLQEMPDKRQMYISPGIAPPNVIKMALPERIFFKLAGLDPLLAEGKVAAARLEDLGKRVECEITEDVPHYWDHLAKTEHEKWLRQKVYEKAADEIVGVLDIKSST
ncbi:Alpha/Beta hydrolase protein [Aspergillus granulosus]|uniref:Alpha/Beta hydrolase protein n=1 Tax=Aspergillus granulosus TaxID=176169 RepID=A0ABR4HXR0_9EURO